MKETCECASWAGIFTGQNEALSAADGVHTEGETFTPVCLDGQGIGDPSHYVQYAFQGMPQHAFLRFFLSGKAQIARLCVRQTRIGASNGKIWLRSKFADESTNIKFIARVAFKKKKKPRNEAPVGRFRHDKPG